MTTLDGRARTRGIVLTSAEAAHEGVDATLDLIQSAGANAVAINPGVFVPSMSDRAVREPPLDLEGEARVLDRPLWGEKVQYLEGFASHEPDRERWSEIPFALPSVAPEGLRRDYAGEVIEAARARGLKGYIFLSPTILPGLPGGQSMYSGNSDDRLGEFRPVRVDGSTPDRAIAGQGCLNNPTVKDLGRVRLLDAVDCYRHADGFVFDWAEYTCYLPEDLFTCFCVHCEEKATREGYDWASVRAGVTTVFDGLSAVTDAALERLLEERPAGVIAGLARLAGAGADAERQFETLARFKAESVRDYLAHIVQAADAAAGVSFGASAFAPPWDVITGARPDTMAQAVDVVRCKLFTFQWPMMTRWLAQWLLQRNPGLDAGAVLEAVKLIYDVPTGPDEHRTRIEDYQMPEPDEPHPVTMEALTRRLLATKRDAGPDSRVEAMIHSYRPLHEIAPLLEAADCIDGIWIQRYGYLSDEKFEVVRAAWAA